MAVVLNDHQRFALDHHCRLAGETINPAFGYVDGLHSIVLTVNSGYE
jgi:hypothetical protein